MKFILDDKQLKDYLTTLSAFFHIYHRTDGRSTKIGKAAVLSALCGSVSRSQILVTGMYGDYKKRDIPNADRLLSSNSESSPGSGNRYTHKFRRMDAAGAAGENTYPLFTLTKNIGLPYILSQCDEVYGNDEEQKTHTDAIKSCITSCYRDTKGIPKHWHHTNHARDFAACAYTFCTEAPFYYPELLVCNQYAHEQEPCIVCDKNIRFRMDGFYVFHAYGSRDRDMDSELLVNLYQHKPAYRKMGEDGEKENKNPCDASEISRQSITICCYEQDTGSQRSSVISGKAEAYLAFFHSYYAAYESHVTADYAPTDVQQGQQDCTTGYSGSYANLCLCFGISNVYSSVRTEKKRTDNLSDASARTRKLRDLSHQILYSAGLCNAFDVSVYLNRLDEAYRITGHAVYKEHKELLLQLMHEQEGINDLKELFSLAIEPHTDQLKRLQVVDSSCCSNAFGERRNFIFSAFESSFHTLFLKGARILAMPNQMLDAYFKLTFPSSCGLYSTYCASFNQSGIPVRSQYEPLSCYVFDGYIHFPEACLMRHMDGSRLIAVSENYSLDLSSRERIKEFYSMPHNNPNDNVVLVISYMEQDKHELLHFLKNLEYFYFSDYDTFKHTPSALLCCMEESALTENPLFGRFCADGTIIYSFCVQPHIIGNSTALEQIYDIVPADASGIMEGHEKRIVQLQ